MALEAARNSKTTYIGQFDNFEEAKQAYADKAREIHGEFARLS